MMQLFLMRHGEAAWSTPDEARELTARGRQQTNDVLAKRAADLAVVQKLLVSPYQRALQSAALFEKQKIEKQQPVPRRWVVEWLTPDSDPQVVLDQLAGLAAGPVLLVAHNPLLTRLLNLLLGAPAGRYHLGTSALVGLDLPVMAAGCAELRWLELGG